LGWCPPMAYSSRSCPGKDPVPGGLYAAGASQTRTRSFNRWGRTWHD
jgi:hypothetical protein